MLLIFTISLVLRGFWAYFNNPFNSKDSYEYFVNSKGLTVEYEFEKDCPRYWWEHSPAYILYLHLTERVLLFQVLLSSLTVVLLWYINPLAGWLFCFYPVHINFASSYNKETLMQFVIVIYLIIFYSFT